jgi:hypothetical protein
MAICSGKRPTYKRSYSDRNDRGGILRYYGFPARAVRFDFLTIYSECGAGEKAYGQRTEEDANKLQRARQGTSPLKDVTIDSNCPFDIPASSIDE